MYERILHADSTDAEAYWSLVLCKYGVEYVEDPETKKRIPTCNRTQFTSIFSDVDYQSAISHADSAAKKIYEMEAEQIDKIQKGILEISAQEDPFDIFICYKEKDERGERTPDSVLAQDLYYELTEAGFKVFFARITLESKLGTAYEPYIFAALNSAKVMVVIGTKPEHISAVWVRNEWSRYLALIRQGAKKTLIPAYRDMDPYDLPEEFSHLQALDMSKLGFMQDLVRGIVKLTQGKIDDKTPVDTSASASSSSQMSANNLRLAGDALSGNNWQEAISYANKVLEMDPENPDAWLIKMKATAIQAEKERYQHIRLQEANYCGENAIQYAPEHKKEHFLEQKFTITEEMARGYVQQINYLLGSIDSYFSSALTLANMPPSAMDQLMNAAFLVQQLGDELPFSMGMRNIVSSTYYSLSRYVDALYNHSNYGVFSQHISTLRSYANTLKHRIGVLQQEEKAENQRQKELAEQKAKRQKEINEAFWNAHADAYDKFTHEREHLKELAKNYDYSMAWRDMSLLLSKRIRQLDEILNAPREADGDLSSSEQAFFEDNTWEAKRQELQNKAELSIKEKQAELARLKQELAAQQAIVENNRQLFGSGAKKRKAAQEQIEELESKIYQAERWLK